MSRIWGVLLTMAGFAGILPLQVGAQSDVAKDQSQRAIRQPENELPQKWVEVLRLTHAQRQQAKPIQEAKVRGIQQVLTATQNQRLSEFAHHNNFTKADFLASLQLTPAQEAQYEAIQEQREQQEHELEQHRTLSDEARKHLTINIAIQSAEAYIAMLTPEQRLRQSDLQNKRRQQWAGVLLKPEQQKRSSEINKIFEEQLHSLNNNHTLSRTERDKRLKHLSKQGQQQYQKILTIEQRKQFEQYQQQKQAIFEGGYYGMPMLEMLGDLTTSQRQQIKTISGEAEQQFRQILTAEQKQTYKQLTTQITKSSKP